MLWPISKVLFTSSDIITKTFLAFFIWQTKNDLETVLIFSLAYFAAIPVASLISGFISDTMEPKIAILLGTWIQIFQLLALLFYGNNLSLEVIAIIALIGGMAEGLRSIAEKVIDNRYYLNREATKVTASKTFIKETLLLFLPLSTAYLISTSGSYVLVFKITILILLLNAITITLFSQKHVRSTFNLLPVITFHGTNRDKSRLVQAVFIEGLSEGVTYALLPIVLLTFVGSLLNWGLLNTSFVLLSVAISFLFNKYATDLNFKFVYATGAFLFASASVFFLTQFNFFIVVIFLIAKSLMDVIKETGYYSSLEGIIAEDRKKHELYAEYQILIEFVTSLGRLVPIVILVYMGINIHDDVVIRFTLLVIGILPLITLSFLGKTVIFNANYQKEDQITPQKTNSPSLLG